MSTTPTDAVIRAIAAVIEAELPDLLRENDLPLIDEVLRHDPPRLVPTKSQIWVDTAGDRRSDEAGRGATLHRQSHVLTVLVGVASGGPDAELAASRMRQYVDLLKGVVESDQTVGGNALWIQWQATDYSPNTAASGLYRAAILTFDVNRRSARGAA